MLHTDKSATALRDAEEVISDALLIARVLKAFPVSIIRLQP